MISPPPSTPITLPVIHSVPERRKPAMQGGIEEAERLLGYRVAPSWARRRSRRKPPAEE